eukprot:2824520-Rhodomonas_salina.1
MEANKPVEDDADSALKSPPPLLPSPSSLIPPPSSLVRPSSLLSPPYSRLPPPSSLLPLRAASLSRLPLLSPPLYPTPPRFLASVSSPSFLALPRFSPCPPLPPNPPLLSSSPTSHSCALPPVLLFSAASGLTGKFADRYDYLAPYLPKHAKQKALQKQEAQSVKDGCLKALKERLIDRFGLRTTRIRRSVRDGGAFARQSAERWIECGELTFGVVGRAHIIETRLEEEQAALTKRQLGYQRQDKDKDNGDD